ncbi:MAG: beta strand repeat-containing protein, partial [Bacteroidales bacterium]
MKRLFITTIMLFWVAITFGQLTGTKLIPGDYPTLDSAITDLNTQGVGNGGVTFELLINNPQTAPAGGYVITATGDSSKPIIFKGNGNTITSSNSLTPGALNDAIFKIIGGDYITIDGFVMQENSANTTTTPNSNNMTEFGVALFYATTTNGPQHCSIINNTITLGNNYQNAFGIYANSRHNSTAVTTANDITDIAGAFNNLTIHNNTISNVNLGIVLVGSTNSNYMAQNITVTNNNITFGRTGTFSSFVSVSGSVNGIYINNTLNVNVNNNTITCNGTNTAGTLRGIYHHATGTLPTTGNYVNSYNNNTITLTNGYNTETYGIHINNLNEHFTTNVNGNTINNLNSNVATSSSVYGIYHQGTSLYQNINGNILMLNPNTTGTVYAIHGGNTIPANGTQTVQNNSIQINKSVAGGTVYGYYSFSSSTSTVVKNISNNTFNNITLTGATTFYGIYDFDGLSGSAPTKNIHDNVIQNITGGTSPITLISTNYGVHNSYNNTINSISNGANITGINAGGISTSLANVYNNQIHNLTTTSGSIKGIVAAANATGSTSNVYANTIYNLEATSATSSVGGISVTGGNTVNVYNNFIKELYAPNASSSSQPMIAGIALLGGTNLNVYYNTVYLDATSTGTDFSTCALYANTTPNVKLINNILVDNSTPNGTGISVAFRRSEVPLLKYDNASNNNCLYAGTPSPNHLVYYDGTNGYQTMNDFITAVLPRETASISNMPPFVN